MRFRLTYVGGGSLGLSLGSAKKFTVAFGGKKNAISICRVRLGDSQLQAVPARAASSTASIVRFECPSKTGT